jgi:hypothetical protein
MRATALPGDDTTQLVSGVQLPVCAALVPRSQEACDGHPRQAMPAQIKEKRKVTHHRAVERELSQRSVQGRDECLETPADVLVHAADMMRDWRHRNNPQQNASSGSIETIARAFLSILKRFKMLRNASEWSALLLGSSAIHQGHRDHITDHTGIHRGHSGAGHDWSVPSNAPR